MPFKSLLILFFLSIQLSCLTQENLNSIAYRVGVTKMDFFTGIEYGRKYFSWKPFSIFEIGINRSVFQSRLFPKLTIGTAYFILDKEKIKIGPLLNYSYSLLKVNSSSGHLHRWNEVYGGLKLETGKKLFFQFNLELGLLSENYYDQIASNRTTINTIGYRSTIGLGYAW